MQIDVRDSLAEITAEQWNALCDDGNPFLRHEFLHTLDITGCLGKSTGWYPRYFLLWSGEGAARELQEETMLDINPKDLVYLGTIKDGKYNRFCKLYKAEMNGKPEPTLDHEHSEFGYYDVKSLPHPIEEKMKHILELNI